MAKKKSRLKKKASFIEQAAGMAGTVIESGVSNTLKDIKSTVDHTLDEAEKHARHVTQVVMKTSIIFLLMLIGALFLLVGIGQYLNTLPPFAKGFGFVLIGVFLILFGVVSNVLRT